MKEILKKGLSIDAMKYLAIAAMLLDHIANAFVEEPSHLYSVMTLIGRMTGPVMFFAAVEAYHHTKNLKKYAFRLFVFAVISYLPFMFAFHDNFNILRLNVIFTIFLGILAVHARRSIKDIVVKTGLILLLIIASIPADYGVSCIVIMLVLDYYYGNRKNQIVGYIIVAAFAFDVLELITRPFFGLIYDRRFDMVFMEENYYLLGYVLPIFLFYFYNDRQRGKNNRFSKWLFYIFYPLHLSVIAMIRIFLL